ncbi:MAG TPA: methyltransferase domain-containing protein [bacterium]|nr:methyltransferase domain-containing protein [bacterium]
MRTALDPRPQEGGGEAQVGAEMGFHWEMLSDSRRNAGYRAAIAGAAPGRVVYDVGAGVGPMSLYALEAGARRVYAIETDRDAYQYLRRLARRFPALVPMRGDALRGTLPDEAPDVVICEMWSSWLTDWPMVPVLNRIRRRAPRCAVIPARGHHVLQLGYADHYAGAALEFAPGTSAAVFGEPGAIEEMSLPVLAATTDFQATVPPFDVTLGLVPLTSGTVNSLRFWSYEEVRPGHLSARAGTRADVLIRWVRPFRVTRGRRVRVRVRHRWDDRLRCAIL